MKDFLGTRWPFFQKYFHLHFLLVLLLLSGCGDPPGLTNKAGEGRDLNALSPSPPDQKRMALCPPVKSPQLLSRPIYGIPNSNNKRAKAAEPAPTYAGIREAVNSACMRCHQVPARTGGFSYVDSYRAQEVTANGESKTYPGFSEAAEAFASALLQENESKRMPPENVRRANPELYLNLGRMIKGWIASGKPTGHSGPSEREDGWELSTELGNCIPQKEAFGLDYAKDRLFAGLKELPKNLDETDLFTLDGYDLARKGTVAYNVEYPLWSDNADKARHMHVPMKIEGGKLVRQAVVYDQEDKKFHIPDNSRFYKTFYKKFKNRSGRTRLRPIETRIIVVRSPWKESLFGTYRWNEDGSGATLVETPYRDGTPFKDLLLEVEVDETTGKKRKYALPGRHRCLECHMGSEGGNFVLGFTPLQINRCTHGDCGVVRDIPVGEDEKSQVSRLIQYGVLKGVGHPEELPKLEWTGQKNPRNIYELRAQAYFVGNCAHCHNPSGFAFTKENGVNLNLSMGEVFDFNTHTMSTQRRNRPIIHHEGDLDQSYLYQKVSAPPEQQGMLGQMPMHTPGVPDCRGLQIIGQWIKTWEGLEAAENWKASCKPKDEFPWIEQDFTWPKSEHYLPRRADWTDPEQGMPAHPYRDLEWTPELLGLAGKKIPVGYWNKKPECSFPEVNLPPEQQRPWMLKDGQVNRPKRPFGEVYMATPGAWTFRTTCVKCHGNEADGDTALARGILNWSGGSVRVADLKNGLFGDQGQNSKAFDVTTPEGGVKNLGPNYLVWMTMAGTRVKFPDELSVLTGKHGGQMLNQVRDKCLRQISPEKASSPLFPDHEIYREICFLGNRSPQDPALEFNLQTSEPLHPVEVEEWLNRGAYNAGFAIYQFLMEKAQGKAAPGLDECEKLPKTTEAKLR